MTEPSDHTKVHHEKMYHGVTSSKGGAGAGAAGRTAFREEFQRDYGPHLDEPLDVTESGHEF